MQILGHGLDLVEVPRIARLLQEHGQRFQQRCFTSQELAYCADQKRLAEHLAGRFAAKEAILKALGTGLSGGIQWTDIEILRAPSGQPVVTLHGQARQLAEQRGIRNILLSITHTRDLAAASAIALGP